MEMTWLGVGSAFTLPAIDAAGEVDLNTCDFQTNAMIRSESGKIMLIDCGSDIRFALAKVAKIFPKDYGDIDAVYLSHLHADHVGGIEAVAFCTCFNPNASKPKLYANHSLMVEAWEKSLRGGLESIQGDVVSLTHYFDCHPIEDNQQFMWEGILFTPVQTVHVVSGFIIKHSYGLLMQDQTKVEPQTVFLTTDTQFAPNQIMDFYAKSDVIFHDCETSQFSSKVHSHFRELAGLPDGIRQRMWLLHYQPGDLPDATGFAGFVRRGQVFEF